MEYTLSELNISPLRLFAHVASVDTAFIWRRSLSWETPAFRKQPLSYRVRNYYVCDTLIVIHEQLAECTG